MNRKLLLLLGTALLTGVLGVQSETTEARARNKDEDKEKLAAQAFAVLKANCAACHHEEKNGNDNYDVLSYKSLTETKPSDEAKEDHPKAPNYVTPNKLKESLVWVMLDEGHMPPKKAKKKPSKDDKEALKKWIEAGAPKEGFAAKE
jgi:mono/diheme cytochrome c family protein